MENSLDTTARKILVDFFKIPGMTDSKFIDMTDGAISPSTLGRMRKGESSVSFMCLETIAKHYNKEPRHLFLTESEQSHLQNPEKTQSPLMLTVQIPIGEADKKLAISELLDRELPSH